MPELALALASYTTPWDTTRQGLATVELIEQRRVSGSSEPCEAGKQGSPTITFPNASRSHPARGAADPAPPPPIRRVYTPPFLPLSHPPPPTPICCPSPLFFFVLRSYLFLPSAGRFGRARRRRDMPQPAWAGLLWRDLDPSYRTARVTVGMEDTVWQAAGCPMAR